MKQVNIEKELNKIQYGDRNKLIGIIVFLLVIIAVGSTYALYQVRHTQKLVFNTVSEFKKRDIYLSVLVDGEYKNDFPAKSDDMLYGGYECDGSATINFDTDKWQVALYASHPDKCTVKFGHKYVDQSGANYPELYQGMIPVYFENGKIYVADITSEWYNYDENKWANAVLIDYANKKDKFYDDNGNLLGGHEVSEEDILQMYVWIPRYKYELWNVNNEGKPKQLINIEFEEGTANTGDITCTYTDMKDGTVEEKCVNKNTQTQVQNNEWYTHPAFTFGNTNLKGIWVGKFEPSDAQDETGRNKDVIGEINILPSKTSMVNKTVSTMFNAERAIETNSKYNLNSTEIDTHIAKNIEWGAMTYLTQSIYGIYKDENTCNIAGMDKDTCEVWINNTAQGAGTTGVTNIWGGTYTGCVGDSVSAGVIWNQDNGSVAKCKDGNRWNEKGVNASSTGNMYGVYDISGGAMEYVMGVVVNQTGGGLYIPGSGFQAVALPELKYYDMYTFSDENTAHKRGHLGDSTKETLLIFGNLEGGWNADYARFPYAASNAVHSWFSRGGAYNAVTHAGIFAEYWTNGGTNAGHSFRSVLSAA